MKTVEFAFEINWPLVNCKVGCTHISLLFIVFGTYNFDKTFKYVDKHEGNETGIGIA